MGQWLGRRSLVRAASARSSVSDTFVTETLIGSTSTAVR